MSNDASFSLTNLIEILDGELHPNVYQVNLRPKANLDGFELMGFSDTNEEKVSNVAAIDGLLFEDPLWDRADKKPRQVVVWRRRDPLADPARPCRITLEPGSAALVIEEQAQPDGAGGLSNIMAFHRKPTGEPEVVSLTIGAGAWRFQELESLFVDQLTVLYGDTSEPVVPEYPVPAAWVPAIKPNRCTCEKKLDGGGRLQSVTYTVEFLGLRGMVQRTYQANELVAIGDPQAGVKGMPFRLMVWPQTTSPTWRYYVLEIGRAYDLDWIEGCTWSLYTRSDLHNEQSRVVPCQPQMPAGKTPPQKGLADLPGSVTRVVSANRPRLIELKKASAKAGGTFTLLGPTDRPGQTSLATAELGVDIGTSNSCISVKLPKSDMFSMDFNQLRDTMDADAAPDPKKSMVLLKVGNLATTRTETPWLPGIEGLYQPERAAWSTLPALTQIPSLVIAMEPAFKSLAAATATEVSNALPILDVNVPPVDFVDTFANATWVERSFTKLKWFGEESELPKAFLQKYIASIFLMTAAKIPGYNFTAKFSYPLAFDRNDKKKLEDAALAAAREVDGYTGVKFTPQLYTDESRCIVAKHLPTSDRGDSLKLFAVCDIGGGSVDVAIATATIDTAIPKLEETMVFLGADSIRFGADLLFNAICDRFGREAFPPAIELPSVALLEANVREQMRRAIRAGGWEAVVKKLSSGSRQLAADLFNAYFKLVAEYLARSVAGAIRNPYRLYGALHRYLNPPTDASVPEPHILAAHTEFALAVDLIITGNGWRCLDAFNGGRGLDPQGSELRDFSRSIAERIRQLVHEEVLGEPEKLAQTYQAFRTPDVRLSIGLQRPNKTTVLKEALADAVLSFVSHEKLSTTQLSAVNGINERIKTPMDVLRRQPGRTVPWYSYVGSDRISWENDTLKPVTPPDGLFSVGSTIGLDPSETTPAMPKPILQLGTTLRQVTDLHQLLREDLEVVRSRSTSTTDKRERSLFGALFEVSYSRLFDRKWRDRDGR